MTLSYIDHIAIESKDIENSVQWYLDKFNCEIKYQDKSWALLKFDNIQIALVTPGEHPPHFAVVDKSVEDLVEKKTHRDGIHYIYEKDLDMNVIEKIHKGTK